MGVEAMLPGTGCWAVRCWTGLGASASAGAALERAAAVCWWHWRGAAGWSSLLVRVPSSG